MPKQKRKQDDLLITLAKEKNCDTLISEHPELFLLLRRPLEDFRELSEIDLVTIEPATALGLLRRRKGEVE